MKKICIGLLAILISISFLLLAPDRVSADTDTVIAALVEYLKPVALTLSRTSEVVAVPWILMQRSMIWPSCFLPTRKATSRSNW